MNTFTYPATIMLGCTEGSDEFGRRKMFLPKPLRYVTHFNSEGMRRRFMAGEVEIGGATHTVPVYRGLDNRAVQMIKNDKKQAAKKSVLSKLMKMVGNNVQQK